MADLNPQRRKLQRGFRLCLFVYLSTLEKQSNEAPANQAPISRIRSAIQSTPTSQTLFSGIMASQSFQNLALLCIDMMAELSMRATTTTAF